MDETGSGIRLTEARGSGVSLTKILGAYGGVAAVSFLAAVQVVFAAGYLLSCELRAGKSGQCEPQWIAAQALLFGAGGTTAGLMTKNPLIRDKKEEDHQQLRDEHGRFVRRPD